MGVLLLCAAAAPRANSRDAGDDARSVPPQTCAPEHGIDWAAARREYFYLHKVMATDLGPDGDLRAHSSWLRRDSDPLVTRNPVGNRDIRSHLRELFTFTLFFAPRTIVELGVRSVDLHAMPARARASVCLSVCVSVSISVSVSVSVSVSLSLSISLSLSLSLSLSRYPPSSLYISLSLSLSLYIYTYIYRNGKKV